MLRMTRSSINSSSWSALLKQGRALPFQSLAPQRAVGKERISCNLLFVLAGIEIPHHSIGFSPQSLARFVQLASGNFIKVILTLNRQSQLNRGQVGWCWSYAWAT